MAPNMVLGSNQKCSVRSLLNTLLMNLNGPLIKKSGQNYGRHVMMRFGRRWRWCLGELPCQLMYVCPFHVWRNVLRIRVAILRIVIFLHQSLAMLVMAIFIPCQLLCQMMWKRGNGYSPLLSACLNGLLRWTAHARASMVLVRVK